MAEYKLKHTGEEIDEKLDKIDELSEEKNTIKLINFVRTSHTDVLHLL